MKTKIDGRYVVGYDEVSKEHVVYKNGEVVFEEDNVLFVGQGYEGNVDRVIDASRCLVSPGLIDMHALMDVGIHPRLKISTKQRQQFG